MKTDSLFYSIFQEFPFIFFALLGIPADATNQYQFTSQEIKQLAFRLDGLFLPIVADSQLPFYIVEVQFQPDPNLYYRLFAELFIYLKQYQPPHPWQLVVIYPNRQTERENSLHFQEMLELSKITRIYLNELTEPETASLPIKLLKLVIEPENTAPDLAVDLARQAETEIANIAVRESFINLLETIIVYKLPEKSREEIAAMFNLSDLKQTRVYQEILEEVQTEAQAQLQAQLQQAEAEAKQREQAAILRMFSRGLATEDIATFLDLPVTEVAAIITQTQQQPAMNQVDILSQIYTAITTAPQILTPPFIEQLIARVLPLAESDADSDTVEAAINEIYREFKDVRNQIKALKRKNLDDAEAEIAPGYETIVNNYPDIKKLEASLKKRIQTALNPPAPDAKN